jgi:hypothetical protein
MVVKKKEKRKTEQLTIPPPPPARISNGMDIESSLAASFHDLNSRRNISLTVNLIAFSGATPASF